jgi:hypothetical protein
MFPTYPTYIDEEFMITKLLNHDWIVIKNTWTNCPQDVYNNLKQSSSD